MKYVYSNNTLKDLTVQEESRASPHSVTLTLSQWCRVPLPTTTRHRTGFLSRLRCGVDTALVLPGVETQTSCSLEGVSEPLGNTSPLKDEGWRDEGMRG